MDVYEQRGVDLGEFSIRGRRERLGHGHHFGQYGRQPHRHGDDCRSNADHQSGRELLVLDQPVERVDKVGRRQRTGRDRDRHRWLLVDSGKQ